PSGSRRSRATRYSALTEKFAHPLCDESAEVFQREVSGINQVQFRVGKIPLIRFRAFHREKGIVLTPENQHPRLSFAEVLMPTVIESDIRLIVVKKIELNCRVARTIKEELVQGVGIRTDSRRVFHPMCVLKYGGVSCQERDYGLLGLGIAIRPERLHGEIGRASCRETEGRLAAARCLGRADDAAMVYTGRW